MPTRDAANMLRDMARRRCFASRAAVHIGSQITEPEPISAAVQAIVDLARVAASEGIRMRHPGYRGRAWDAYGPIRPCWRRRVRLGGTRRRGDTDLEVVLEPGRWSVAPAGILVTEVVDLKKRPRESFWQETTPGVFVIVDAGMTDLIRPAFYGAWHGIEPVAPRSGPPILAEVVGPICETSDTLGRDRRLPPLEVGDLMAVRETGAYGAVMASNYNRRPIAAEVMVDGRPGGVVTPAADDRRHAQWDE